MTCRKYLMRAKKRKSSVKKETLEENIEVSS
jgi:hypothetical protein